MKSNVWVATGISGSGRVELLQSLEEAANKDRRRLLVHDVGSLLRAEFKKNRYPFVDDRILDADPSLLRMARSSVMKGILLSIGRESDIQVHVVGVHATFRWKGRLIPGVSYQDLSDLQPSGFLSVVDEVKRVHQRNKRNPKWDRETLPSAQGTQEWMIEEEFVSELYAEAFGKELYLVSANHTPANLAELVLGSKPRLYLSFPITAIQDSSPEIIVQVQGPILQRLQESFVVFNPWWIEDMPLAAKKGLEGLPELVDQLTPSTVEFIKKRTIERDFQFIDQADAVVVFYLTEKVSPGVLAEVYYAHRMQKPVYMVFPGARSPFLEDAVTVIERDVETLLTRIEGEVRRRDGT